MSTAGSAPGAGQAPRHNAWRLLASEPHRLMFFFGALQGVAAGAWLLGELAARHAGWFEPYAWSVSPAWAHAWLFLYGLFPFFIFGFLMTAGPNWVAAPKMPQAAFVPAALAMAAGVILFYFGLAFGRSLAAAGVFLHLGGWLWGAAALARLVARHRTPNTRYAAVLLAFHGAGLLGSGVFALSIAAGSYGYVTYALHGAVWFFLLPIFLGVATRMVPFFSSRILGESVNYRPAWARPALLWGTLAHGVLEFTGDHGLLWLVDLPLALLVGHLAVKWGIGKSMGVRLLAVLHISTAVLAAALLLSGALSLALATGQVARINAAPLHLIVIGYFSAMALGMVSRVSLGHSGRALEADRLTWGCYLGVVCAALLRVGAEFTPAGGAGTVLMIAASVVWLAALGLWAARYVPMYLRPRVDAPR